MKKQFEISKKYTLISSFAMTIRKEITIIQFDEKSEQFVFKVGRQRALFLMPKVLKDTMVFEGHNLPLKLDSDTNRCMINACYNFVTANPQELVTYLEVNCLNYENVEKSHIMTVDDTANAPEPEYTPLFPEATK